MGIVLAEEKIGKRVADVVNVDFDFKRRMAPSETIAAVVSGFPTIAPAGGSHLANATPTVSGQKAQVAFSGGVAEQAFSAVSGTGVFTALAHGLSDGDTVGLLADTSDTPLPVGVAEGVRYWVVSATADTFKLAKTSGGPPITLTADGQGRVFVEYLITMRVTTDDGQTLEGQGRVQARD